MLSSMDYYTVTSDYSVHAETRSAEWSTFDAFCTVELKQQLEVDDDQSEG